MKAYDFASVFISYRRTDSAEFVEKLGNEIKSSLGATVFLDTDGAIEGGEVFPKRLQDGIESASAVLVIIGSTWLDEGQRRGWGSSTGEQDFVLREVRWALTTKRKIVPVLVGGARMPDAKDLPAGIAELALHQAVLISDGADPENLRELLALIQPWLDEDEAEFQDFAGSADTFKVYATDGLAESEFPMGGRWRSTMRVSDAADALVVETEYQVEGTLFNCVQTLKLPASGQAYQVAIAEGEIQYRTIELSAVPRIAKIVEVVLSGVTDDGKPFECHLPLDKAVGKKTYSARRGDAFHVLRFLGPGTAPRF